MFCTLILVANTFIHPCQVVLLSQRPDNHCAVYYRDNLVSPMIEVAANCTVVGSRVNTAKRRANEELAAQN